MRDAVARSDWTVGRASNAKRVPMWFLDWAAAILEQIPQRSLRKPGRPKTDAVRNVEFWARVMQMPVAEAARMVATLEARQRDDDSAEDGAEERAEQLAMRSTATANLMCLIKNGYVTKTSVCLLVIGGSSRNAGWPSNEKQGHLEFRHGWPMSDIYPGRKSLRIEISSDRQNRTDLSRKQREHGFPKPIKLGESQAWFPKSEVHAWLQRRAALRNTRKYLKRKRPGAWGNPATWPKNGSGASTTR